MVVLVDSQAVFFCVFRMCRFAIDCTAFVQVVLSAPDELESVTLLLLVDALPVSVVEESGPPIACLVCIDVDIDVDVDVLARPRYVRGSFKISLGFPNDYENNLVLLVFVISQAAWLGKIKILCHCVAFTLPR